MIVNTSKGRDQGYFDSHLAGPPGRLVAAIAFQRQSCVVVPGIDIIHRYCHLLLQLYQVMWFLLKVGLSIFNLDHMSYVFPLSLDRIPDRSRWPELEVINMCNVRRFAVVCDNANVVTDLAVVSSFQFLLSGRGGHVIEAEAFKSFQVRVLGRIHQAHEKRTGCKSRKAESHPNAEPFWPRGLFVL